MKRHVLEWNMHPEPDLARLAIVPGEAHHQMTGVGDSVFHAGRDGINVAVGHALFSGRACWAALDEGEALLAFVKAEAKYLRAGEQPAKHAHGRECADEHERQKQRILDHPGMSARQAVSGEQLN